VISGERCGVQRSKCGATLDGANPFIPPHKPESVTHDCNSSSTPAANSTESGVFSEGYESKVVTQVTPLISRLLQLLLRSNPADFMINEPMNPPPSKLG